MLSATPGRSDVSSETDIPRTAEADDGQTYIVVADEEPEAHEETLVAPAPHTEDAPPRIRRFWSRKFKSFDVFEVTLGNFNVIAGANNSGKSTLLQGIDLLYSLLKLHAEGDHLSPKGRLVPVSILPVATPKDLFHRQEWRKANVYVSAVVGAEFSDGSLVEFDLRFMFGNINSRVTNQAGIDGERLVALLAHAAVWVPSSVGIVIDEDYRPPARQRGLISAGRHNEVLRNSLVELKTSRPEALERIQQILLERFGAGIGEIQFEPHIDQFVTGTYRGRDGTEHDLYSSGAGFVQVLQMLAFVLGSKPSVVLLDEPDAHLHSSLQRVVVEILDELSREERFQILLATHSKEIINFVDPTRLILIEAGADAASLVTTEVTPIAILRSLGAIDNVDAYALVKSRRCLFLEGTSDVTILGRFAATVGVHAFTGDDRVVTVPVGGADRFEHVQQLDVLEAVLGSDLRSLELRDRDGRLEAYRRISMDDAERPLHIFDLDCIESYLVNVEVIARVVEDIRAERSLEGESPAVEEIRDLLIDISDELRQDAEDRIAQRYAIDSWHHEGKRPDVPSLNSAARDFVGENWGELEDRLRVLPGKRLLSAVRREIQDRYGVNFGNERLAEAFEAEEIHQEILEALAQVGSLAE